MQKYLSVTILILLLVNLTGCRDTAATTTPTVSDPTVSKPVVTEPTVTEPIVTEPTITDPIVTEPTVTEPEPLVGWQEIDGKRYFYNDDGTVHIGWLDFGNNRYYMNKDGSMHTGWLDFGNNRYYMNKDGSMHTGWLETEESRYYFRSDGTMARGRVTISDSETRYFTSTGKEIILANPWNFVPADYAPVLADYEGYQVAAECVDDLKQMIIDCAKAGHSAVVVSAYRTHDYQAGLYQRRIQRFLDQGYSQADAEAAAAKRVAYPGTSEHELGLALDIVDKNYQKLTEQQETMPAQRWLMENCWKYGFILRYPNDKSDQTGIIYEPWHYRYVGKELAKELHNSGLCLEEYLDAQSL